MKKRNKLFFKQKRECKKEKAPINTVQNVKAPKRYKRKKYHQNLRQR